MLRIIQNQHAAGAKSYYSAADYYSAGQELSGRWRGIAAAQLGLQGEVRRQDWKLLCDNRQPGSGERLTRRTDSDRTVGYDFNFHVPKSVSLLYGMTRDERIFEAFRDSVDRTMQDIEAEMATRVRKKGKNENRTTGNMVWGEFIHTTSRPVDGIPDPHLHAHCFVHNVTWDNQEQVWKAGQFQGLKRDAPYFEAMFHSRFAERLANLGLPIERTAKGWELGGITKTMIQKFSRRTAQIEDYAHEKGIEDPATKAELGAKTRQRKQKELSFNSLQSEWDERLSREERQRLMALERQIGSEAEPFQASAASRAVSHAAEHHFERSSVVPERTLLATALKQAVGQTSVERIHDAAERSDLIIGQLRGRRMATTRQVLGEERQMLDFARRGRGSCAAYESGPYQFQRDWLNGDQRNAVQHILRSRDKVMLVRGAAGVGKTTLLQEAIEAIEAHGTKVLAFAPSADASRGVQRDAGFHEADTVARLLLDENIQQRAAGQLIWIDEAGQLGAKTMAAVFKLADRLDARVLLSGDRRQHGSVERGAALRLLEEEAGLMSVEVKEIQRQKGEYRAAVRALSEGNVADGFRRLERLGWVREAPAAERHQQLAADYVQAITSGETALVVSPTHAEGRRVNQAIRSQLHAAGALGEQRKFLQLENARLTEAQRGDSVHYQPGDVLQFHQNAKGFQRGQRVAVGHGAKLPLDQSQRFQLFHAQEIELAPGDVIRITQNGLTLDKKHRLDNGMLHRIRRFDAQGNIVLDNGWTVGKDFGHLTYGYVVTSHASQGKTVDHVFISQGSESFIASSREQFYVSVSRARKSAMVYTDDKAALRDAVNRSDERFSATELVTRLFQRQEVLYPQPSQKSPERELADERS